MYDVLKGIEGSKRPNNYTPGFGIVSCKLVVAGWDGFGDTLLAKCFALDMQILDANPRRWTLNADPLNPKP